MRHCFSICLAALLALFAPRALAADSYVHIHIDGVINPIKARYVERALALAKQENASFLLISIDTPGGLVSSMEDITRGLTNSKIPIVGFVHPTTAQATSAGAFILLACDVVAMAPRTRVGAAHPVGGGAPLEGAMDDKATNSLASLAKSLAARRARPEGFGESIVRQSLSFTAEEAKSAGAVEIIATDLDDLLPKLDGRKIALDDRTLHTAGIREVPLPLSRTERLLDLIANPTLASIFMTLGVLGILYELSSPGVGMAGIVGVICLLLGLAAMSVLPLALGGFLLIAVGLVAIGLEVKIQTHGLLAVGGTAALILGALFLIDEASYFGGTQHVDWRIFAPFVAVTTAAFVIIATVALRARRNPFRTGVEAFVGKQGHAKSEFTQDGERFVGSVFVDGARWEASADEAIANNAGNRSGSGLERAHAAPGQGVEEGKRMMEETFMELLTGLGAVLVLVLIVLAKSVRIVNEYERGVVFRLGRVEQDNLKGPGLRILVPFVDRMLKVDLRTVTLDVPPQEVITKDNVTIKVNAVVYFNVMNPTDAVLKIANHFVATSLYAQTTLRNILGQHELDEILAERDKIGQALQRIIDEATDAWGVKVSAVEIKDIELPEVMRRAMARQAEAERERRAKVIAADGEFQASQKLFEAAQVLEGSKSALQLRYLQTLVEIGVENSTTIVFPLPLDLTAPFAQLLQKKLAS